MINLSHKKIIEDCFEAKKMSYSPYSDFSIGAALLAKSGIIYKGCNIENASYSMTVCAERTAFFKAVSQGEKEFEAIAITGGCEHGSSKGYVFPCGACRQVMMEFCDREQFIIYVVKTINDYRAYQLSALFPHGFGPEDLFG